jgi:hypothetical protein
MANFFAPTLERLYVCCIYVTDLLLFPFLFSQRCLQAITMTVSQMRRVPLNKGNFLSSQGHQESLQVIQKQVILMFPDGISTTGIPMTIARLFVSD